MIINKNIDIDYVARVEGETNIHIELEKEPAIELRIFEPPRFFEGFLVGRKFSEVGDIVSRICGICPVSHMNTAILAVEKAMNIEVSPQSKTLRRLMTISQIAASHLIHLYMLVLPDYYNQPGVVQMLPEHMPKVNRLLKMKNVLNRVTGLIGGRALHPVALVPGGFTSSPSQEDLNDILIQLREIKDDSVEVVRDIASINVPDLEVDSEYAAIDAEDKYAINEGRIISSKGLNISVDEYMDHFEEFEVTYGHAKYSVIKGRGAFMTGALARQNIKHDKMHQETKDLAASVGFKIPCHNPYYNNLAQALEVADGIQTCIDILQDLKVVDDQYVKSISPGEGGVMTEAPRGLLYHWYQIDRKGVVTKANIVSPTAHHYLNIEKDLKELVKKNRDKERDEIVMLCEKLVRAYDPCFSCSVH